MNYYYLLLPAKTPIEKIINLLTAFVISFTLVFLMMAFLNYLWPYDSRVTYSGIEEPRPVVYDWFISCLVAPIWEELAYRYGPIEIARKMNADYVLPTVVMSSC